MAKNICKRQKLGSSRHCVNEKCPQRVPGKSALIKATCFCTAGEERSFLFDSLVECHLGNMREETASETKNPHTAARQLSRARRLCHWSFRLNLTQNYRSRLVIAKKMQQAPHTRRSQRVPNHGDQSGCDGLMFGVRQRIST